jgi:hypothetical protein
VPYFASHFKLAPESGDNIADFAVDILSSDDDKEIRRFGECWSSSKVKSPFSSLYALLALLALSVSTLYLYIFKLNMFLLT